MAYGSVAGVEAMTPTLAPFGEDSTPSDDQVEAWLDGATAAIHRELTAAGYATPVTATPTKTELDELACLYAAARALDALGLDTTTCANGTRSERMFAEFWERLKRLCNSNLAAAGVGLIAADTGGATAVNARVRSRQMVRVDRQT